MGVVVFDHDVEIGIEHGTKAAVPPVSSCVIACAELLPFPPFETFARDRRIGYIGLVDGE